MSLAPLSYSPRHWLVCLDLDDRSGQPDPLVLQACRRALTVARSRGWRVVHLFRAENGAAIRPLPGLAPLPSETVLTRPGLSAFSSKAFREQVTGAPGAELAVIGADMASAALATGLAADDGGMRAVMLRECFPDTEALRAVETLLAGRGGGRLSIAPLGLFAQSQHGLRLVAANQP